MADTILLEIVTPTGVALREQVTDVTAPSVAGEFGVLPGHLPLLAALRTGLVTYHQNGQEHRLAVHHGFVEVANDTALLLTERFAMKDDVDVVRVRRRLKEVEEKDRMRDREKAASQSHFARLSEGTARSIETSTIHLDTIRDLKEINSLLASMAYPVLEEHGLLSGSRLKAD